MPDDIKATPTPAVGITSTRYADRTTSTRHVGGSAQSTEQPGSRLIRSPTGVPATALTVSSTIEIAHPTDAATALTRAAKPTVKIPPAPASAALAQPKPIDRVATRKATHVTTRLQATRNKPKAEPIRIHNTRQVATSRSTYESATIGSAHKPPTAAALPIAATPIAVPTSLSPSHSREHQEKDPQTPLHGQSPIPCPRPVRNRRIRIRQPRMSKWLHYAALNRQRGMSTAEYAVGTIAACAFAALLFKVVSSSEVQQMLTALIDRALKTTTE
ncbi:DUF4244 domain-containing protein [Nonomuraea candida]|uniref:DUF4244 domain-containing protein n=1 Tax=Nonomuraea candida TaxID=359159 RepID=UPI001FDFA241|nr:DUF4244 domain-containing protein [Nonomuraea candida]